MNYVYIFIIFKGKSTIPTIWIMFNDSNATSPIWIKCINSNCTTPVLITHSDSNAIQFNYSIVQLFKFKYYFHLLHLVMFINLNGMSNMLLLFEWSSVIQTLPPIFESQATSFSWIKFKDSNTNLLPLCVLLSLFESSSLSQIIF